MASPLFLRPRRHFALGLLSLALQPAWADEVTLDTVTVTGEKTDSYQAKSASVSGFGEAPLLDTPASVAVVNRQLLDDQQARLLSDVLKNDASVGQSYAPIGYYENFAVRGFSLNEASSYWINGHSITGEQNVALENKEQVELLKGLSGLQSGMSEPGGLVNYVTKRPDDVRSVSLALNDDGERYIATDLGTWIGAEKQVGVRINLAHEDIGTYVEHADGRRDFASLALDWNISPNALLQFDVEYQKRKQRSVPGYQLLGGTTVPHDVDPEKRLGDQSWGKPVSSDSLNLGGRFEYRFNDAWTGSIDASRSKVVVDDYSTFAWGCYGAASCASAAVPNYFSAEGDYDVSDYRNPDDTRRNDELQLALAGRFDTGVLAHQLTVGTGVLRRTIDRRKSVNEYIGTGNIYQDNVEYEPTDEPLKPSYRTLDSRQYSLFFSDRISYGEHWQTVLGGRLVHVDEKAYSNRDGSRERHTQRSEFLPDVALIYKPRADISLYTRYSEGLSLGKAADWYTTNDGETLPPTLSRQIELGIKRDWQRASFGAALFQLRQAYAYSQPNGDGTFTYVQQGEQKNVGLELSASGWLTQRLQLAATATAIRARVSGSGTDAYDDHQAINVPKYRASLSADYRVPGIDGLALLGGVQYSASKYANQAGTVEVGDYAIFDIGSRYTTKIEGYETVLRLTVDNLFDKRYWRDVGLFAGDGYLFPGAPRTARLSATVNF
ncbi:TonB-dependent siderophore receptor [Pseudomonas sp. LRF_L74]|uniref:TonB-dependent siderophore receptor n=1 Tax=Pseudomonas sp. LRF_L74 TaxID=3369422 RepID=UPI003F62C24F